jgi:hypothetical protein
MKFIILVPLSSLPLLLFLMVVMGGLDDCLDTISDYLPTMLKWLWITLIADVILYNILMPASPDATVRFTIGLLLITLLAPFVGCYVRYIREQRRKRAEREEQNRRESEREGKLIGGIKAEAFPRSRVRWIVSLVCAIALVVTAAMGLVCLAVFGGGPPRRRCTLGDNGRDAVLCWRRLATR